jgi:hypothetical protein
MSALDVEKLIMAINRTPGYTVRSYSGRGMMGMYCVAVTVDSVAEAIADIMQANSTVKGLGAILRKGSSDSMGTRKILYFPDFDWPE